MGGLHFPKKKQKKGKKFHASFFLENAKLLENPSGLLGAGCGGCGNEKKKQVVANLVKCIQTAGGGVFWGGRMDSSLTGASKSLGG